MSASGPGGLDEVGDGRTLEGAVGGDIPGEDNPNFGDVIEGTEGVDACR